MTLLKWTSDPDRSAEPARNWSALHLRLPLCAVVADSSPLTHLALPIPAASTQPAGLKGPFFKPTLCSPRAPRSLFTQCRIHNCSSVRINKLCVCTDEKLGSVSWCVCVCLKHISASVGKHYKLWSVCPFVRKYERKVLGGGRHQSPLNIAR